MPHTPALPAPPPVNELPTGRFVGLCGWCSGRNSSIRAVRHLGRARAKLCFAISCGDCSHFTYGDAIAIPGIAEEVSVNDHR